MDKRRYGQSHKLEVAGITYKELPEIKEIIVLGVTNNLKIE